jgi:tetratricopeptide (TPR) repeat protein
MTGLERIAMTCAALGALLPTCVQDAAPVPDATTRAAAGDAHLQQAGQAAQRCDWEDMLRLATLALGNLQYASDAWFEALYHKTVAQDRLRLPEEVRGSERFALEALSVRERKQGQHEELGPPTPSTLSRALSIQILVARALQSAGEHEPALMRLKGVLDILQRVQVEDGRALAARVLLDAAWGERALGNEEQARTALSELRDHFPATREAAIAMVLLQEGPEGPQAYRGKYAGDARHRARIEAVRAAIPAARARLAARLRREEGTLPRCPVGVADVYPGSGETSAITETDSRRACVSPVVIVFSEGLALEAEDLEQILVHELAHAVLSRELGARYGELPVWVTESISQWAANQWPGSAKVALTQRLLRAPERFATPSFWIEDPLRISAGPCGSATQESGLALWQLGEDPDSGMLTLIARLSQGEPLERSLEPLLGPGVPFEMAAARELEHHLEELRQGSAEHVARLVAAKAAGPKALLQACDAVLEAAPPAIAHGYALWQRAKALEALGRTTEALLAFEELHRRRLEHPAYVENARIGRARCLLSVERREEAAAELARLQRDAFTPAVAAWANRLLTELAGK